MRSAICFIILILLSSCNKFYDKIEIKSENIVKVEKSMELLSKLMKEKVMIDSVSLNARIDTLKKEDTLSNKYVMYYHIWDYKKPQQTSFYLTHDSTVFLHYVEIAKNLEEFSKNINNYNEFSLLSLKEKNDFINSINTLTKNKIWSCFEGIIDGITFYYFEYSKDNLYYSSKYERFLILKNEFQKIQSLQKFIDQYEVLDHKNGIVLYKRKEIKD